MKYLLISCLILSSSFIMAQERPIDLRVSWSNFDDVVEAQDLEGRDSFILDDLFNIHQLPFSFRNPLKRMQDEVGPAGAPDNILQGFLAGSSDLSGSQFVDDNPGLVTGDLSSGFQLHPNNPAFVFGYQHQNPGNPDLEFSDIFIKKSEQELAQNQVTDNILIGQVNQTMHRHALHKFGRLKQISWDYHRRVITRLAFNRCVFTKPRGDNLLSCTEPRTGEMLFLDPN